MRRPLYGLVEEKRREMRKGEMISISSLAFPNFVVS
jgi:hypothetical protein